jgi:hypothetical protein
MAGGHACWLTEDDAVEMAEPEPEQIHSSRPSRSVKSPSSSASLCAMHGRLCFCRLIGVRIYIEIDVCGSRAVNISEESFPKTCVCVS